jgi:ribonuclease Z
VKKIFFGVGVFVVIAVVAAWLARDRLLDTVVRQRIDQTLNRVDSSILSDGKLHVILCGTAAALPDANRAGPCTAIIANGEFWLIDIGPGAWRNLDVMNLPVGKLSGILITHLHSDHIGEIGEAMTQSWIAGRSQLLDLYGPSGIEDVAAGFAQVYSHDEHYRVVHHDAKYMPPEAHGTSVHVLPTPEGLNTVPVFERNGLRVSAFRVNHAPVDIAFGYRIEYGGRVVVISGDTIKSPSVIHNAQNADLLIHEALAADMTNRAYVRAAELGLTRMAKLANDVRGYHTTPVEAAESASEAHVKKLVITHVFPPLPNAVAKYLFLKGTHEAYAGPIVLGEDRMRIDLEPVTGAHHEPE